MSPTVPRGAVGALHGSSMQRKNPTRAGAIAMLLVAGLSACRDGTGPVPSDVRLELRRGDLPFEEETIEPGATVQLNATLLDAAEAEHPVGTLSWSSSNAGVATVNATGRVMAVGVGSTRIVVRSGERADSGSINVALPVTGLPQCAPGEPGLSLTVGEARTFVGEEALNVCLTAGASNEDFLVLPFNSSLAAGARLDTRVISTAPTLPSTDLIPARTTGLPASLRPGPRRDDLFHEIHLARSRAEFEPALRMSLGTPPVSERAAPSMGAVLDLNAGSLASSGCEDPDYRTGRVVAISQRAVIVADTMNPAGGFSSEQYATIGETFDDLIWSINTANFGQPTDIDENERVIIFYTRAVNELTPSGADSYVGGFFYNRDLFPTSGTNACAGSNEAEMFYMLVPDPQGEVNGNARSRDFVMDRTFSVLAHEFQHLINDSRRLYVNESLVWEDSWLNEGLSHIAEELAYYAASGLQPRSNAGTSAVAGDAGPHFFRYNIDNLERYVRYLREPEKHSLMGNVDQLATRGAAWVFLRYVADREPGDDQAMWTRLVNSNRNGLENLEDVLGVDPRQWMHDWQVSVYTDDAGFPVNDIYTQPSWNFRLLLQILDTSGQYPLRTRSVGPTSPSILLEGGGAAFIRTSVPAGAGRALQTTVNDLPPPSRLKLTVVRTR